MDETTEGIAKNTIVVRDPTLKLGFTVVPNAVFGIRGVSHGARLTYVLLLKYAWREGACYPGVERMATDLEVERKAVTRYTKELADAGLVSIKRRGLNKTNVYYINQVPSDLLKNGESEGDVPSMGHQEVSKMGRLAVPAKGRKQDSETKIQNGVWKVGIRKGAQKIQTSSRVKNPEHVNYLADEILKVCGDDGSRTYYRSAAGHLPDDRIFQFLSEIKADEAVRNPGAVFVSKVKAYLAEKEGDGKEQRQSV